MNQKELEAFAKKAAKSLKSEKDLSHFSQTFKKVMLEAALAAELDDHLGYEKHQSSVSGLKSAPTFAEYPWAHSRAIMPQLSQVYRRRRYG